MRKLAKIILLSTTAVSVAIVMSSGSSQNAAHAVSAAEQMQVREHINKGNYFLGKRQFDKAIAAYEEALGVDSESQAAKDNIVLVYNNWGIMLFQQGKYPEAKQKWERALKLNPTYVSAKKNISTMKAHLQKIGLDPEEATRGDGDEEKKPPQQSAVILTPGVKQPGGTGDSGSSGSPGTAIMFPPNTSSAAAVAKPQAQTSTETSASTPFSSGSTGSHKKQTYGSGTIMFRPSTPTAPAADPSAATSSSPPTATVSPSVSSTPSTSFSSTPSITPSPSAASTPPAVSIPSVTASPPVTPSPTATSPSKSESPSTGQTIDEKLASIELKVYGRKLGDLPVMKRLEKLESDTIGQVGTGTVYQRVENLKRHYGM